MRSEMSARASRLAFALGSFARNGLIGVRFAPVGVAPREGVGAGGATDGDDAGVARIGGAAATGAAGAGGNGAGANGGAAGGVS